MMRKQGLKPFLKFSVCVLGGALAALSPLGLNAQQAVLYVGSDWCDASTALEQIFTQAQFAKDAGLECVVVDEPQVLTEAAKAQHEKQKAIRFELERYPGLAYFDAQGRCVFLEQGLAWNTSRKRLLSLVEKGRSRDGNGLGKRFSEARQAYSPVPNLSSSCLSLLKMPSIMRARAPSPVTLQAVPKLS